jgi:hypothetical protein
MSSSPPPRPHVKTKFFWIEFPYDACFFLAHSRLKPLLLLGLPIVRLDSFLNPNAFKCIDIRRGKDGCLEYYVKDWGWLVLLKENGANLDSCDRPQILQVTFDNGITISDGRTTVPNAFWILADEIKEAKLASAISPPFFAKDVANIQRALEKRTQALATPPLPL